MNVDFSKALEALKEGKRVRRSGWPLNRRFIFRQVPAEIPAPVIPNMQSLPPAVKDFFMGTFEDENEQIDAIYYDNQVAEVGLSNTVKSFAISIEDVFALDWEILD